MDLKILSLNICHTLNTSGIIELLKSEKPDMLFLQEVPHTSEELNFAVKKLASNDEFGVPLYELEEDW